MMRSFRQALARRVDILSNLALHVKAGYEEEYRTFSLGPTDELERACRFAGVSAKYFRLFVWYFRLALKFAAMFLKTLTMSLFLALCNPPSEPPISKSQRQPPAQAECPGETSCPPEDHKPRDDAK
jgi:hypothetical protein